MSLYLTCVLFAAALFIFVGYLLRKGSIKEGFAILWLGSTSAVLLLAIFPQIARALSNFAGISVPSNLVFFFGISLLVVVSLVITHEIGKLQDKVQQLAQDVAILKSTRDRE
jgi:hypothetical protein